MEETIQYFIFINTCAFCGTIILSNGYIFLEDYMQEPKMKNNRSSIFFLISLVIALLGLSCLKWIPLVIPQCYAIFSLALLIILGINFRFVLKHRNKPGLDNIQIALFPFLQTTLFALSAYLTYELWKIDFSKTRFFVLKEDVWTLCVLGYMSVVLFSFMLFKRMRRRMLFGESEVEEDNTPFKKRATRYFIELQFAIAFLIIFAFLIYSLL